MCSRVQQRARAGRGARGARGWSLRGWLRGVCCCGCCDKRPDDPDRPTVNQATGTAERVARPHRPHAPGNRKSTPEMLSAVRCALSQLQGEPAPPLRPELPPAEEEKARKAKTRRVNHFTIR